jgi:CheY-like chemotaxis protein
MSGKEALEKVSENTYDIIFIDHRMPEMDGIETLEAMQKLPGNKCKTKPCIALTANAISGSREMYLKAGFTDYLSKPISPRSLENIIRKYLPKSLIEPPEENEETQQREIAESVENTSLPEIEGIDMKTCLEYCGDQNLLTEMLVRFYSGINSKSEELETFLKAEDIENFRIKVHALKSSAKLIGALELSKQAEELEKYASQKNLASIKEKAPAMLTFYRTYLEKLSAFVNNIEVDDNNKLEISQAEFSEKLKILAQAVDDFDSIKADEWLKEMSNYSVPKECESLYKKLKTGIENIEFNALKELILKENRT